MGRAGRTGPRLRPPAAALLGLALLASVAGCGVVGAAGSDGGSGWVNRDVRVVSTVATGSGVAAMISLDGDRRLRTIVVDMATGEVLWNQPAAMPGRPSSMGVQPPVVVPSGENAMVVAVEPRHGGQTPAVLVARDARSGKRRWVRPIMQTLGPQRCGRYVCLTAKTRGNTSGFTVLAASDGHVLWRADSTRARVQHTGSGSVTLLRLGRAPVLSRHSLRTGEQQWSTSLGDVLGRAPNTGGRWRFTSSGRLLVGYIGPYRPSLSASVPGFGFFAVDIRTGEVVWRRPDLVRPYPGPAPSRFIIAGKTTITDGYSAFGQIDPRNGDVLVYIPRNRLPSYDWRVGLSADLGTLGLVPRHRNRQVTAFELRTGSRVSSGQVWTLCRPAPQQLAIEGAGGFFPPPVLCAYDLRSGDLVRDAGPPPRWFTTNGGGWQLWQDQRGALHAVRGG